MIVSYERLFKKLQNEQINAKVLAEKAGISASTLTKMKNYGGVVTSEVLAKICIALDCGLDDIIEIINKG